MRMPPAVEMVQRALAFVESKTIKRAVRLALRFPVGVIAVIVLEGVAFEVLIELLDASEDAASGM